MAGGVGGVGGVGGAGAGSGGGAGGGAGGGSLGSAGPVPGGIVGDLYVRAVYNDRNRVMLGCGDALWCPYEMFRTQMLKWSIGHSEYVKECRNP